MAAGTRQSNRIYLQTRKEQGADDGWPYLGRYFEKLPSPIPQGAVFDSYTKGGKPVHIQKFDFVSGYLVSLFTEEKEIQKKKVKELCIVLGDENSPLQYQITLGNVRSGYSRALLQRLCSPDLDPAQPMEISLYQYTKENKEKGTGLTLKQNGKKIQVKDADKNTLPYLKDMPDGVPTVVNGDNITDFTAQMNWLFNAVKAKLPAEVFGNGRTNENQNNPALQQAPTPQSEAPSPVPTQVPPQAPPVETPPPAGDDNDLPF